MVDKFIRELGAILILVALALLIWANLARCGQPLSETMEQVSPGKVRVYANPKFYKDPLGTLRPIDVTDIDGSDKDTIRKEAGIRAVEIGKADGKVTLRGPFNDLATLTMTLESVKWDSEALAVSLAPATASETALVDLGGLLIQTRPDGCRVLLQGQPGARAVSIAFRVSLVGLEWREEKGRFVFTSMATGRVLFVFNPPGLCDAAGNRLRLPAGSHVMAEIDKGILLYTKDLAGLDKLDLPKDYTVDVDTVYSETGDGYIMNGYYIYPNNWDDVHDSLVGPYSDFTVAADLAIAVNTNYNIGRVLLPFDLSALSGSVTAASLFIKTGGWNQSPIMVQRSTATTPYDNNSFLTPTGSSWGTFSGLTGGGYQEMSLNAQACTDLTAQLGGTVSIMIRDKNFDYDDVAPTESKVTGCYFSESAGNEPYLELTLGPPVSSGGDKVINFF